MNRACAYHKNTINKKHFHGDNQHILVFVGTNLMTPSEIQYKGFLNPNLICSVQLYVTHFLASEELIEELRSGGAPPPPDVPPDDNDGEVYDIPEEVMQGGESATFCSFSGHSHLLCWPTGIVTHCRVSLVTSKIASSWCINCHKCLVPLAFRSSCAI